MATIKTLPATNGKSNEVKDPKNTTTAVATVNPQPAKPEDKPHSQQHPQPPAPQIPKIEAAERPQVLTIDDRFYRLDVLTSLREKYEKVKDCLEKLNKFKISAEGRGDNITLKDAAGLTFTTFNATAVKQFIEFLTADLTTQLKDLDAQISL